MPDLEAKKLPDGPTVRFALGDAPAIVGRPGDGADFVVPDNQVSRLHAELKAVAGGVRVSRLKTAKNAVEHILPGGQKIGFAPGDSFLLAPGESFQIGDTVIRLLGKWAAVDEPLSATVSRQQIRQLPFLDSAAPLKALLALPALLRCRERPDLDTALLEAALVGVPQADVAMVVRLEDGADRPAVECLRSRRGGGDEVVPSATIVRKALADQLDSFLYRWTADDLHATRGADSDWAICVPLPAGGCGLLALYLAGPIGGATGAHLQDAQKFTDLLAELYKSNVALRTQEKSVARMEVFLPKTLRHHVAALDFDGLLKPRAVVVTVLFCDLRGSCGLAEAGADDLLRNWGRIGDALDLMAAAVEHEDGVIGNLQGDAVMAFWGWPEMDPAAQIDSAVKAARMIQSNFRLKVVKGQSELHCGIGLAHGAAVAGRLGVYDQCKLDVFGPVVNLAARLESLTKYFGVEILADAAIADHLDKPAPRSVPFRRLVPIQPVGMPVGKVCEIALENDAPWWRDTVAATRWKNGVEHFAKRDWKRAGDFFRAYRESSKGSADGPAAVLAEFMADPENPPENWAGSIVMERK